MRQLRHGVRYRISLYFCLLFTRRLGLVYLPKLKWVSARARHYTGVSVVLCGYRGYRYDHLEHARPGRFSIRKHLRYNVS